MIKYSDKITSYKTVRSKHIGRKAFAKEMLDKICYNLCLDIKEDKAHRDYIISKNGVYLFRAILHNQKDFFGVRFKINQPSVYEYTEETITKLVETLIEKRGNRKVTLPSDYSKENHIIL